MLILAAVLRIVMSVFHTVVGERFVLGPIKQVDNLPTMWGSSLYTFRTIQATWHLVSALFAVLAIVPLVWDSGKHKSYIPFGLISAALLASAFV